MGQAEEGCGGAARVVMPAQTVGDDQSGLDSALRAWSADLLAARLAALQRVTAALSAVRLPAEAVEVVLTQGLATLGAATGTVRLLSDDGLWLDLLGTTGHATIRNAPDRRSVAEDAPTAEAVRTGAPIWLQCQGDWQARFPDSSAHALVSGYPSTAALPLTVDDAVIGAMIIMWEQEQLLDQAERAFITALAQQVAQAIDRTRHYLRERARALAAEGLARQRAAQAEEARALATVSAALAGTLDVAQLYTVILEQASSVVPCDHATMVLYEEGHALFVASRGTPRIAPGSRYPLATLWLPEGSCAPTYLPDTTASPVWVDLPPLIGAYRVRSLISVPLLVDGRHVGTFDVSSRISQRYTTHHLEVAAAFGERAAYALRNARLYAAEQARASAAEQLAEARGTMARQAEQLVQMQSDFVAAVSHELRTPLTGVVGYAELLQAHWDSIGPSKRRTYLERIVQSAARQQRLVEDLLLLGKLESAMFTVQSTLTPLARLVRDAAGEVKGSYQGQRITLHGPEQLCVVADPARTVQIVANLLDNAAKYSPQGCAIDVSWGAEAGRCVLRVRDHGPGIPDEARAMLFTRFGRIPGSRMRAGHTGTGLGLHIGRKLARAMSGELDLEHADPRGSTFRLCLPLAEPRTNAEP